MLTVEIIDHPRQDNLIKSQEQNLSPEDYERHLTHLRKTARDGGVDYILETHDVDVILGPIDSDISTMASAGGRSSLNTTPC